MPSAEQINRDGASQDVDKISSQLLSKTEGCDSFLLLMPSRDAFRKSTLNRSVSKDLGKNGFEPCILVIEIASPPTFEAIVYSKLSKEAFDKEAFQTLVSDVLRIQNPLIYASLRGRRKMLLGNKGEDLLRGKDAESVKDRAKFIYKDTRALINEDQEAQGKDGMEKKDGIEEEDGDMTSIEEIINARNFSKLNLLPLALPEP
jgi:hypothetical protein